MVDAASSRLQEIILVAAACHDGSLDVGNDRAYCQVVCTAASILLRERGINCELLSVAAIIAHGRAPLWIAQHGAASLIDVPRSKFTNSEVQYIGCPSFFREANGGVIRRPDGSQMMHCVMIVDEWIVDPTLDQAESRVAQGVHVFQLREGFLAGRRHRYPIPPILGGVVIYESFPLDPNFVHFPIGAEPVTAVVEAARERLNPGTRTS